MQRDQRRRTPVEQPTERLSTEELRAVAEIEEQQLVELPDREAISVVNGTLAIPVGTVASAGLLPDK